MLAFEKEAMDKLGLDPRNSTALSRALTSIISLAVTQPDTTATYGPMYWTMMLLKPSKNMVSLIKTPPTSSATTYWRRETAKTRWCFTGISVERNQAWNRY